MPETLSLSNLPEKLKERLPAYTSFLKELVETNSGTLNLAGVNKVQEKLKLRLQSAGMTTALHEVHNRGLILSAETKAASSSGQFITLIGHADTFFAPEFHFSVNQEGDILRGPGVYDMKGGLVTILMALESLFEMKLLEHCPIRVVVNSSEEKPNRDVTRYMAELLKGSSEALVFESGRQNDQVIVERKGIATFQCHVTGKAVHAGNRFFEGANALVEMSRLVLALSKLTDRARDITCNCGRASGGQQANGVPDSAELHFEIRFPSISDFKELEKVVEEISKPVTPGTAVKIEVTEMVPPMERTSGTEVLFKEWRASAEKASLRLELMSRSGGISDGNIAAGLGIPTLDTLGPRGGEAHTQDEFLVVSSIIPKALNLIYFLHNRYSAH